MSFPPNMVFCSTESLDRVGQREKYLKNTFESLSGAEQEATKDAAGTSISSQFLVRANQGGMFSTSTLRNVAVINAAKQTRVDSETSKKREELQRRIEETRRKLQSVGYRSNLKSSQSITDLSQIPEKDGWGPRGVNHVHRYTPAGGKQYAASLMRHQLNSAILQPSKIIQSSISPVIIQQPKNLANNPVPSIITPTPGKYFTHISKITLENAITKSPASFYNTLPVTKTPKGIKDPGNKTELARLRSLPLPSTLSLVSVTDPKIASSAYTSLPYSDIPKDLKNYTETASLTTKTVMYSTYHTLPTTKKSANVLKTGSASNRSAVVMEITGNICSSSVLSNKKPVGTNSSGLSQGNASPSKLCVGVKSSDDPEPCAATDNLAWVQSPCTNNALYPTANSATKALNAVRTNISGNSIRETQKDFVLKHGELSPSKRPVFLNLRSGGGSSGGGSSKYSKTRSKTPLTNQSLPESPVCEDLNSPTGLFQNLTDTESNIKSSRFGQQRRSCSYFIDLNTLTDNEQEFQSKNTKNVAKSSESLPATLGRTNIASSEENLLDSCDEEDGNGDFSSDSLEEPSEFSNRTPRRCISDYQIFTRPPELVGFEFERRSASAAGRQCKRNREAFHSQESILSNTSGQLSSCNNSGDILEMCSNYEQDRHSSASFFLSLRRRNTNACRSQESILTDESDYQRDRDRHRDSCRSTESILESDYHFSMQRGNLAEYENARHRDSCQSTESILTDDSDCQVFTSCKELEVKNRLFPSTGNTSKPKSETPSTGREKALSEKEVKVETDTPKENTHRPIFRTRSLQDTCTELSTTEVSPSASNSRPQTPSRVSQTDDENLLLQKGNERPPARSLVRKNSYPRSRPQTPTSLQMHSQFSTLNKSFTTGFEETSQSHSLGHEPVRKSSVGNTQESPQNAGDKIDQHRSNRPPTAPKPTGKVTHKPPLKPRQKPSQQQMKQRAHWNQSVESGSMHSQRPLRANHLVGMNSAALSPTDYDQPKKGETAAKQGSSEDAKQGESKDKDGARKLMYTRERTQSADFTHRSEVALSVTSRPGGVKLLCRSFENAIEDYDISDDCAEEDSFPVLGGSGSSTPATSSSAANSPKRLWPPASRAPNQRQLGKRLGTRHQILPSKCSGP
ncbi:hypothetical protein ANN_07396, partial [Periplaneta americana]